MVALPGPNLSFYLERQYKTAGPSLFKSKATSEHRKIDQQRPAPKSSSSKVTPLIGELGSREVIEIGDLNQKEEHNNQGTFYNTL